MYIPFSLVLVLLCCDVILALIEIVKKPPAALSQEGLLSDQAVWMDHPVISALDCCLVVVGEHASVDELMLWQQFGQNLWLEPLALFVRVQIAHRMLRVHVQEPHICVVLEELVEHRLIRYARVGDEGLQKLVDELQRRRRSPQEEESSTALGQLLLVVWIAEIPVHVVLAVSVHLHDDVRQPVAEECVVRSIRMEQILGISQRPKILQHDHICVQHPASKINFKIKKQHVNQRMREEMN